MGEQLSGTITVGKNPKNKVIVGVVNEYLMMGVVNIFHYVA